MEDNNLNISFTGEYNNTIDQKNSWIDTFAQDVLSAARSCDSFTIAAAPSCVGFQYKTDSAATVDVEIWFFDSELCQTKYSDWAKK